MSNQARTTTTKLQKGKPENKVKWEWNRKFFHSSIGLLVSLLYKLDIDQTTVLYILFPITLIYAYLDYLRFVHPEWNLQFTRWLGIGMRPAEYNRLQLTSSLYYLFGACTVLLYFERRICVIALLMLAWGDTAAAFGGRTYKLLYPPEPGKERKKTLAGSFCAFLTGMLIVYFVRGDRLIAGGLICAAGEYISFFGLDDNFTMPLICAALLSIFKIN